MRNILTVCTGNICRSPLAEVLLAERLPKFNLSSAGVGALVGYGCPEEALEVARGRGLDLNAHRARQINDQLVAENDLILVMERGQQKWLADRFPQSVGRTYTYMHWLDGEDVPDPYRRGIGAFEHAMTLLESGAGAWVERLARIP